MENLILDGKATSKKIIEELKEKFEQNPTDKKLAILSIGDDYGSAVYCNMKKKKADPKMFENYGPSCYTYGVCPEGRLCCGKQVEIKQKFDNLE